LLYICSIEEIDFTHVDKRISEGGAGNQNEKKFINVGEKN
jgi:hypothetical protein